MKLPHNTRTAAEMDEMARRSPEVFDIYNEVLTTLNANRETLRYTLESSSYYSALAWPKGIINHTQRSLCMLSGSDRLAYALKNDFHDLLETLERTGGRARVIVVNGASTHFANLQEDHPDVLQVTNATSKSKHIEHFLVSDERLSRTEHTHPPVTDDALPEISATIQQGGYAAKSLQKRFEIFWNHLQSKTG